MPRRLGDLEMPADLGQILALVEQFVAFGESSDHLFGGVVPLLHAVLMAPFWSIGTFSRIGPLTGVPADAKTVSPDLTRAHSIGSVRQHRERQDSIL